MTKELQKYNLINLKQKNKLVANTLIILLKMLKHCTQRLGMYGSRLVQELQVKARNSCKIPLAKR